MPETVPITLRVDPAVAEVYRQYRDQLDLDRNATWNSAHVLAMVAAMRLCNLDFVKLVQEARKGVKLTAEKCDNALLKSETLARVMKQEAEARTDQEDEEAAPPPAPAPQFVQLKLDPTLEDDGVLLSDGTTIINSLLPATDVPEIIGELWSDFFPKRKLVCVPTGGGAA